MAAPAAPVAKAPAAAEKKSGLRKLKTGEVLFNDGDKAESLYIIQKGQMRLYKPKGRGFVEIAVLRTGEVIGEMAYFDDDGGGKRSCAAAAMMATDIIEISFVAFAKTMEGLNPWFKTIINTLAKRLRQTNIRVRELETNSASVNYGTGKHGDYEFLKSSEVIKILGSMFLVYKAHGEKHDKGLAIHRKTLDLYAQEIYGVIEAKMDEAIIMLQDLKHLVIENDKDNEPKVLVATNLEFIRALFIFYNTEKYMNDAKRLKIPEKTQLFLEKIMEAADKTGNKTDSFQLNIGPILADFKHRNVGVEVTNLEEAKVAGITGEMTMDKDNNFVIMLNYTKLKKMLPIIQFMNYLTKKNREKSGT